MYSNSQKLTAVLTHWLKPMSDSVVSQLLGTKLSGINSWVKKFFPVGDAYSVADDLAFLMKPSIDMMLSPTIENMLKASGVSDEQIPTWAHKFVCAMHKEVKEKGQITMFGSIVFNESDIVELKGLVERNLPEEITDEYEVL